MMRVSIWQQLKAINDEVENGINEIPGEVGS